MTREARFEAGGEHATRKWPPRPLERRRETSDLDPTYPLVDEVPYCPVVTCSPLATAWPEPATALCSPDREPGCEGLLGGLGDLEGDWLPGLVLNDYRSGADTTAGESVSDFERNQIATAQLAVDGEIEHGEITHAIADADLFSRVRSAQMCFRLNRGFAPTMRPAFQGMPSGEMARSMYMVASLTKTAFHRRLLTKSRYRQIAGKLTSTRHGVRLQRGR